jgi:soluble lytic murein transglycosylase
VIQCGLPKKIISEAVPALRFCRLVVFALCCVGPVQASVEKDFLAAREAYSKGRIDTFLRQADRFPDRHPLKVYLDYWRLKSHATSTNALLAFADANADTPLSERARQDVARFHGRNANWPAYREVAARLARQDALTRICRPVATPCSTASPSAVN